MKQCVQCNIEYSNGTAFCRECGSQLQAVVAPPPAAPVQQAPTPAATVPAAVALVAATPQAPSVPEEMRAKLGGSSSALWGALAVVGMIAIGGLGWLLGRSRQAPAESPFTQQPIIAMTNSTSEPTQSPFPSISTTNQAISSPRSVASSPTPTPQSVEVRPTSADIQQVRSRYNEWMSAWQNRDIDSYMSYYSRGVVQKRAGKSPYGYTKQRSRMADNWAQQSYISISGNEPDIETDGNKIVLTAEQTYDSSTWWDKGVKRLVWAKVDGDWKIVEESFRKRDGGKK